ncbi:uncharacterized conserved protein [Serpentinimonas raichei]|uniref:Uncharacterized conserved protein n=1 Tax=Serpentinimonas raichei TaxID=1458425 RepID=A0A060NGM6_9BURK|nr:NRDE family protein [Serpentinimonas raichei]BAO80881.1 uncharacterized conserved protein [Serpentinimonas raichei]
MCLIAFAIGQRTDCPLLLAANRDEFWQRPTLPLGAWALEHGQTVYAGRDLLAGGTWLGFSAAGRVALLTNVRDGQPERMARSRGELVTRWLAGPAAMPDVPALLQQTDPSAYGGFNLVLGDCLSGHWCWLSNRTRSPERDGPSVAASGSSQTGPQSSAIPLPLALPPGWCGAALPPGIYGLSNAALDSPWPKLLRLKASLAAALQEPLCGERWQNPLLQALLDRRPASEEQLPATGVPLAQEKLLSSPFVEMPQHGYGTRSSLIARWLRPSADSSQLELQEWTHPPGPLTQSGYSSLCISMWGMPTSS